MTKKRTAPKTASGIPVKEIYTPHDTQNIDYEKDLNDAGLYPFTRGRYKGMFRDKKWAEATVSFGEVLQENPRYRDAAQKFKRARRERLLKDFMNQY